MNILLGISKCRLSFRVPQGLLPLVNVPVLDYVLESLNRCGVEEVFIYSSHFIEQIRNHVK